MSEMVQTAFAIAEEAHDGQYRDNGDPYLSHPERVANTVRDRGAAYEAAALLHDAIEDSDLILLDLQRQLPSEVTEAVDCLTKRDGEPYHEYLERVRCNEIARVVKLADLDDNLRDHKPSGSRYAKYQLARKLLSDPHPCHNCKSLSEELEAANKRIGELEDVLREVEECRIFCRDSMDIDNYVTDGVRVALHGPSKETP